VEWARGCVLLYNDRECAESLANTVYFGVYKWRKIERASKKKCIKKIDFFLQFEKKGGKMTTMPSKSLLGVVLVGIFCCRACSAFLAPSAAHGHAAYGKSSLVMVPLPRTAMVCTVRPGMRMQHHRNNANEREARPPRPYKPELQGQGELVLLRRRVRLLETLVAELCGAVLFSDDMAVLERQTAEYQFGSVYRDSSFSQCRPPAFARARIEQVLRSNGFVAEASPHSWVPAENNTTGPHPAD